MPVYEYRCDDCGERFSVFYRTWQEAEKTPMCPVCGSRHVRRVISRVHVRAAGRARSGPEEEPSEAERPPVFGRKELEAARRQREEWIQQAEAGE